MDAPEKRSPRGARPSDRPPLSQVSLPLMIALGLAVLAWWAAGQALGGQTIRYDQFKTYLADKRIKSVVLSDDMIHGEYRAGSAPASASKGEGKPVEDKGRAFRVARVEDEQLLALLDEHGVQYTAVADSGSMIWLYYIGLGLLLLWFLSRGAATAARGGPAAALSFGKSKGRLFQEDEVDISFEDVAGIPEAKAELEEIIDFLKRPERYRSLGAKIPKGVLLVGPPGTGKTLLARAVAGEAKVPFISINGSEFVEMFVGVGASRVRDLFEQASKAAPCIVFIDELDAIGRTRGGVRFGGGGNDEREQTLNQLLVELDGFEPHRAVIIMSATNRPEVLDPALLRPGRFDRQVLVDRPDRRGRAQILAVHSRGVPLDDDVDLDELASQAAGFAGADLKNLVNEAALAAARRDGKTVGASDFSQAIDRVVAGLERKSQLMTDDERKRIAVHEIGHAIASASASSHEKVQKISIIPHGLSALGYTRKVPHQDRHLMTESMLRDALCGMLGGRAAEILVLGEPSTGATNDLQQATDLARAMVLEYGMGRGIGPMNLRGAGASPMESPLGFSPGESHLGAELLDRIDAETRTTLERAEQRATALLELNRALLRRMSDQLLEEEQLEGEQLQALLSEVVALPGSSPSRGSDGEADTSEGENHAEN